jgi:hypothetical protein
MLGGQEGEQNCARVAPTAIMLIRFRVAINIIGETWVDVGLILLVLRFDFGGVFFARITFPEKMAGQAHLAA